MRDHSTGGASGRGLSRRLGALRAAGMSGAAAAALLVAAVPAPANAQMMGFGGTGGFGGEQMASQMAPMLEMMKQRMGKKRYAQLMQTFGPMMANMMDGGGGDGGFGGGGFSSGGFGGMGMGGMGMGGMDMGAMMGMVSAMDWRSMQGLMGSPRKSRKGRR